MAAHSHRTPYTQLSLVVRSQQLSRRLTRSFGRKTAAIQFPQQGPSQQGTALAPLQLWLAARRLS